MHPANAPKAVTAKINNLTIGFSLLAPFQRGQPSETSRIAASLMKAAKGANFDHEIENYF